MAVRLAPLVFISEFRTIAADDLWLSTASGRDTIGIHFTWRPLGDEVAAMLPAVEAALGPFEPRRHWGRLFAMPGDVVASRYPHLAEARAVATRLDPDGKL